MSISRSVYQSISSLACFNGKVEIADIPYGMSHSCFKVTANKTNYFVKKLNPETANTEVNCVTTLSHAKVAQLLTPAFIYVDKNFLVTKFIESSVLVELTLSNKERLRICLTLMSNLHQTTITQTNLITKLDINKSIEQLIKQAPSKLVAHLSILKQAASALSHMIKHQSSTQNFNHVMCHGDLNFSNVLLDDKNFAWLIDFECAHIAPREFDIAMFIAVNNISSDQTNAIIEQYTNLTAGVMIDRTLLYYYQLYSYFINGLWYLTQGCNEEINGNNDQQSICQQAYSQWSRFDQLANKQAISLPKLSDLL